MTEERCETCRYWRRDYSSSFGENGHCRRNPQTLNKRVGEWCGEYWSRPELIDAEAQKVGAQRWKLKQSADGIWRVDLPAESLAAHKPQAEPEKPKAREPGFYWLRTKPDGNWIIASWAKAWTLWGFGYIGESEILEIDERRIERQP